MEDMWDIKWVLESPRNTYNKVESQYNSELWSLTSSPTQSSDHLAFRLMHRTRPTSDFGDIHMHR
jgi:hypothetical protein